MPKLYIIATPIGNLEDISPRALRVLGAVDAILAEDTRTTLKLLNHFNIKKAVISYHQHSRLEKISFILDLLGQGKDLALVSEAGTPGISDPGNKLIQQILHDSNNSRSWGISPVQIIPIPGPSALIVALSVSGFPADKFLFLGFPPHKKGRKKFFSEVLASRHTVVFYESCHRILKTLGELGVALQQAQGDNLSVVVCRELTKKFETIYRGSIDEVAKKIEDDKVGGNVKGEFVVVANK